MIDSITVDSRAFWNNDGIDIVDCDSVAITNSYIDSDDDGICLKSHDPTGYLPKYTCKELHHSFKRQWHQIRNSITRRF